MPRTQLNARQLLDNDIQKVDLDTHTPGQAVITRLVAGAGVSLQSTGVDSGTGDVTIEIPGFHFVQAIDSTSWHIIHNLNKFPSVVIADSNGDEVFGSINFTGVNELTITFSQAIAGQAYLT
jgi:hypothetical protein